MTEIENEIIARDILRLRLSQMMVNEEYKAGRFKIPIHLALGHEAIAVAVDHVMKEQDRLILSHRNIAYNLARVKVLRPVLDEYFLKPTGLAGAKLGSMNLANPAKGVLYSSSILGNNYSVAVGVAFSQKILSQEGIAIVLGGDGSIEEGSFWESLIMLRSLKLSALVIIENNGWSMSTPIKDRRHSIAFAALAESLNIKFVQLNGNDPYSYTRILQELRDYSLLNETPVFIEVMLSTLGYWRKEDPKYPEGRFINYHSGPAPSVAINQWPGVLKEADEDPLFVLRKYFSKEALQEMSYEVLKELQQESYDIH